MSPRLNPELLHYRQLLTSPVPCLPHSVFVTMTNTSAATSAGTGGAAAAATLPAATTGPFVRPSRCSIVQGTTHCTCEAGYTISGRDSNICTGTTNTLRLIHTLVCFYIGCLLCVCVVFFCLDIDECELFHNGQAGKLCLHACVNTPGGYRCTCPVGYNVTRDGRSCRGALTYFFSCFVMKSLIMFLFPTKQCERCPS